MLNFRDLWPQQPYPKLANEEQLVAQAALARGIALLTNRRIVVAQGGGERSVALSSVGAVEVGFVRSPRVIIGGAGLILLAALLFMIAAPIAGFLAAQASAIDSLLRSEAGPNGASGVALLFYKVLRFGAGFSRWLPLIAWAILIWGVVRVALALRGQTEVKLLTVVGDYQLARSGRSEPLDALGREIAQRVGESRR